MRFVSYALVGLLGLSALVLVAAFLSTTKILPPPEQVTGYRETSLRVAHRDVALPVHLWYPTTSVETPALLGQNALFYGHYGRKDAAMQAKAPVVLLSHGSGGNALQMGWLASHLANRGYLVIAPNHPGTTSRDSLPERTVRIWERPADFRAIIDWLGTAAPNGIRPDLSDITALGFSLGGHTALALAGLEVSKTRFIDYCQKNQGLVDCGWLEAGGVDFATIDAARYDASHADARISRAIAIDPALAQAATPQSVAALARPLLILNLGAPAGLPQAMRADGLASQIPDATYNAIPGAAHFSALPPCSLLGRVVIGLAGDDNICSDKGLRPRAIVHDDIRRAIDAFLGTGRQ